MLNKNELHLSNSWLCVCFCLWRRLCSHMPFWCLLSYASWDQSTSISSSLKPKIKHSWTSARVLPRSTKSPFPPPAKKWSWFVPLSLTWMTKYEICQRWRVLSKWRNCINYGEAGLKNKIEVVVCKYLFNDCDLWNENPCFWAVLRCFVYVLYAWIVLGMLYFSLQ